MEVNGGAVKVRGESQSLELVIYLSRIISQQ
jgi:hypothetical protein